MKKFLALTLVLILALSMLASCGLGEKLVNNVINGGDDDGDDTPFPYGNGNDFIKENLKGDYSITYEYSYGDEETLTVKTARTSEGYYFSYYGIESLYIKDGDKYVAYQGSAEEGFTKIDFLEPMELEEVESYTAFGTGFMSQYSSDISGMKRDGSETVAGRDCDKYTYSIGAFGVGLKYSYSIDKATGVCLKWAYDLAAGGNSGSLSFTCTEFKTSGVTLPSYS